MKKFIILLLAGTMLSMLCQPAFSQSQSDTAALGLAGDNLDLYAVLSLFQKSKTIEEFEKSLNSDKEKINNLDLNLDKKVDFIKVTTKKNGDSFQFILQVDVNKKETQDVAVILLDKDKKDKVSLQIVGDEELYGKDYVIEPKGNSSVTPNPGYTGDNPVTETVTSTQTVVVQSAPIVQYVYSPAYVPYAPPYYYGYYPPWFGFATVMAVGIYRHNHYYHHGGYYGGHYHGGNNNVIINNNNNFNNYNNNKMRSNTVQNNRQNGNYGNGSIDRGRNNSSRPTTGTSDRQTGNRNNASSRPSTSNNMKSSASNRPSTSNNMKSSSSRPSTSNYSSSGRTRSSSGGGYGGGGYGGGSRGGGGGMRGGGRRG